MTQPHRVIGTQTTPRYRPEHQRTEEEWAHLKKCIDAELASPAHQAAQAAFLATHPEMVALAHEAHLHKLASEGQFSAEMTRERYRNELQAMTQRWDKELLDLIGDIVQLRLATTMESLITRADRPLSCIEILQRWPLTEMRPSVGMLHALVILELASGLGHLYWDEDGVIGLTQWLAPAPPSVIPPALRFAIFQRDGYRCRLCGASARDGEHIRLEIDHITPRSQGGTNDHSNLWVLCFACNRGKGVQAL